MGRHKSKNPKETHIGIRVDKALDAAITAEGKRIERELGLTLKKSDIVRMLIQRTLGAKR